MKGLAKEKKVLFVATVVKKHIMEFHIPYLKMFKEMGWKTAVAARNDYEDSADCKIPYCDYYYNILFERSPLKAENIKAYLSLKKLIDSEKYDIVHCHTPVGGILTRFAARSGRKKGLKVIYTAHGFHFYKGAPLQNWLLFYPVEWLCSWWTDVLITVNKEDYRLAKKKFHAKRTEYVRGVGIDVDKFRNRQIDIEEKRKSLNLQKDDIMLLSVGELNENKNHSVIICALSEMKNPKIHYFIAGSGRLEKKLEQLSKKLGIEKQIHLLGYRDDVEQLLHVADIYLLPSQREGLNVSLMEAMASGVPCIVSKIRGNMDLILDNKYLVGADDVEGWESAIKSMIFCIQNNEMIFVKKNSQRMEQYDSVIVNRKMKKIYQSAMKMRFGNMVCTENYKGKEGKEKIKIMHLLRTGGYSGAEKVAISIIDGEKDYCDSIYVSPDGVITEILRKNQIQHCELRHVSVIGVRSVVKKINPDIIHAHDYTMGILAVLAMTGKPVINHLHNNSPWIRKYGIKSAIYLFSSLRYSRILAVSESVLDEYVFGSLISNKAMVIGNPVDIFSVRKKAKGKGEKRFQIAFLGRMSDQKKPFRFLKVVADIKQQMGSVSAVMIGDGELYDEVKKEIDRLGLQDIVLLAGFQKNPYPLLKQAKTLCMPSGWEGFGLAAVEALALGIPVIATDVGGLPGIVDKSCGYLCQSRREMAEEAIRILSDEELYGKLHKGALARAATLNNIDSYMKAIKMVYERMSE